MRQLGLLGNTPAPAHVPLSGNPPARQLDQTPAPIYYSETPDHLEILSASTELIELFYNADCFEQECFLTYPKIDKQGRHPFHFETLSEYQQQSEQVKSWLTSNPEDFKIHALKETELICHVKDGVYKIAISDEMLPKLGVQNRVL